MSILTAPTTRGAVASEWIKLRTVRSTAFTVLVAVLAAVLVGTLDDTSAANNYASWTPAQQRSFDPVRYGFSGGFYVAVLAVGTLGVLSASSEYGTGLIRTTFAATPRRRQVLIAKSLVTGGLSLAVGLGVAFATFFLGQNSLSARHLDVGLGDPHVLRAVVGAGTFLAVFALVGLAVGVVVRRSAGGVALLFGLFFIAPMVFGALSDTLGGWTLQTAFESLSTTITLPPDAARPSAGQAVAVCAVHLVVAFAGAALLIERRDA
ncbi:ABC transporter permease subunit [Catenulispora yoronensis]|uniref:ABC transporter permease subunit n=1 Tax=Catenulispora yoronensis TaxID=450799 RepID=A0ABP5EXE8_9ACTN